MKRPQIRVTHTFATLEISPRAFAEIKRKLLAADYKHSFVDENTIDMQGIGLVPTPKKTPIKGDLMTRKELRFAAMNKLPVYYVEDYYSPSDKHMKFRGKCVMKKISNLSGGSFYIGNSDIDVSLFADDAFVNGDFPEGDFAVYKINGVKYK